MCQQPSQAPCPGVRGSLGLRFSGCRGTLASLLPVIRDRPRPRVLSRGLPLAWADSGSSAVDMFCGARSRTAAARGPPPGCLLQGLLLAPPPFKKCRTSSQSWHIPSAFHQEKGSDCQTGWPRVRVAPEKRDGVHMSLELPPVALGSGSGHPRSIHSGASGS